MNTPENHPLRGALDHWESVVRDMTVTANEYQNDNWTALELNPGSVTVDTDLPGFDVLIPDDEFSEVITLLENGVDSYQVYLGFDGGVVFAVVALEDTTAEHVVLAPLYYQQSAMAELRLKAENGGLSTRLRTLDKTQFIVNHEDASLFFPTNE
jgi:hypothetical protein